MSSEIDSSDLLPSLLVLGLLYCIGKVAVKRRPELEQLGKQIGFAVFLCACAWSLYSGGDYSGAGLLSTLFSGAILGGVTASLAWVILPIAAFAVRLPDRIFGQAWRSIRRSWETSRSRNARAVAGRREQREYERLAPQREREREGAELAAQSARAAQKRRENARLSCEVLYRIHQPEIKDRFAPSMFDDYLKKHLGDNCPPDSIDERAQQLQQLIQHHAEKVTPTPKFRSMADLISRFEIQHKQLEAIPDDRLKATMLVRLKARYADLTVQVMEEQAT